MDEPFIETPLSTARCKHAIVQSGQKLMHLTMKTLLIGDINNIGDCVRDVMGCLNGFEQQEQEQLNIGNHQNWNMCFLYKIVKTVCGLQPREHYYWTQETDGDGPLESLIYMLMEMRRALAHDDLVIPEYELPDRFAAFTNLAIRLTTALREEAQSRGIYALEEIEETMDTVTSIIEDVQSPIYEDDDEDQEDEYGHHGLASDSVHGSAVAEGGPNHQDIIKKLTRKFWELAGRTEAE